MPRKNARQPRNDRFSVRMDREARMQLRRLGVMIGSRSDSDVMRLALLVYSSILTANERGVRFIFEDPKSGDCGYVWLLPGPPPFAESRPNPVPAGESS